MTESDSHTTEPHLAPIVWAAILAVLSALFIFGVALRPPPIHFLIAASTASIACLLIAGVLVLMWLVIRISAGFGDRYDHTAQVVEDAGKRIEALLIANGAKLDEMTCIIDLVRAVTDEQQAEELLKILEHLKGQHEGITEAIDELREAFVEEGLPGRKLLDYDPSRLKRPAPAASTVDRDRDQEEFDKVPFRSKWDLVPCARQCLA